MMSKKTGRLVLDLALTAMIVAEMFIQFTGALLHEIIGFAFFATVVVHLILSAKWIKNTASTAAKGKMNGRRTALAVMGILLAMCMAVLGVSSVAISGLLADAGLVWTLGSYATWATVHAVSSYALCALVAVHLGMHWAFLASGLRVPYNPSRRRAISTGVNAVAAVGALALGVTAVSQALPTASAANAANQLKSTEFAENASGSSEAASSSAAADSGAQKSKSGKSKRTKGTAGADDTTFFGDSGTNEGSSSSGSNGSSSSSSAPSASTSSSTDATGICTLCRKQCLLSDPKCNKPYAAGLL